MSPHIMQILLVEDNPSDVELITTAFEDCKFEHDINSASDGEEALDYLYQRGKHDNAPRPDLILLDLNLPRQNGQEVLEVIKNDPALRSIPVIILTSSQAEKDIVRSYNLHANCYIIKPVDLVKFLDVVQAVENFWFSIVKLPKLAA